MTEHRGDGASAGEERTWMADEQALKRLQSMKLAVQNSSLVAVEGPHQGMEIMLDRPILHIGRADWCDVALVNDRRVSKHHGELLLEEKGVRIRDLGSRNGVILNGVQVFEAYLKPGLSIEVGDTIFALHTHAQERTIEVPFHDESGLLVGQSRRMQELFSLLARLAPRDVPVLFGGETGTGKTSIAQALHARSPRCDKPFVMVNCGALSPSLIESSLFGYEKGAFTNASQRHRGYFEQAHGGTLFLDEIGELPLELQPKLLDVIERKQIRRLGGEREIPVDFRLLAATHRDLSKAAKDGRFREDLYYRLAVIELEVPALRQRTEDIPLLVERFLAEFHPDPIQVSPEAIDELQTYLWPGNVRQLRNVLERSSILMDGTWLTPDMLFLPQEPELSDGYDAAFEPAAPPPVTSTPLKPLKAWLEVTEREAIQATLDALQWDVIRAAKTLDISKSWLYERIKRYKLRT